MDPPTETGLSNSGHPPPVGACLAVGRLNDMVADHERPWPTTRVPEVMGGDTATVRAFVREYLFVSLFRACAESLASEHASRLAAMQRADKNIDELLEDFNGRFHRVRQSAIDEERLDVIAGFEVLAKAKAAGGPPM